MPQQLNPEATRRAVSVVRRRAGTFARAVHHTYTNQGLAAAAWEGLAMLGELAARPVRLRRERRLDQRLNLDTAADPGAPPPAYDMAFDDAVAYTPVPIHHFQHLIGRVPISRPADYTFVDLGCGKGRTLILAAEHGFRQVIGVERDPRLAGIARRNTRSLCADTTPVSVVDGDVVDYEFPPVPAVVFLFNPFGADTLRAVVKNLERSLEQAPRPLFVAYFNAVHRDVLDDCAALRQTKCTRHWAIYRN
jgi:predicted RNA methylase